MVYSNTIQSMGEMSMVLLVTCIFSLLKCNFSGLHFYTLSQTLIACRAMQLRFLERGNIVK